MADPSRAVTELLHRGTQVLGRAAEASAAARRLAAVSRAIILTLRPRGFVAISGTSDALPASVWISRETGTACAACGKAISLGDALYEIACDGLEMNLDAHCARRHIENWRFTRR